MGAREAKSDRLLEFYCNADALQVIGAALKAFPKQIPDEYVYELGSPKAEDRFAFHIRIRFFTIDSLGHCGVSITMNNNQRPPDAESTQFVIDASATSINRLGNLLHAFGSLKHRELVWEASGQGHLNEEIQNGEQNKD